MEAKKYLIILFISCFYVVSAKAQESAKTIDNDVAGQTSQTEEMVNHKVTMGENIMMISKKYKVKPGDIYEYNPDAAQGIAANQTLQIPVYKALGKKQAKKNNSIAERAAAAGNLYAARSAAEIEAKQKRNED